MLFNSFEFLIFLPLVFGVYWVLKDFKHQNLLLLVASYVFYGWWDWRFTILILVSSIVDYTLGLLLEKTSEQSKRKLFLGLSLFVNLGLLGVFKYYNFFIAEFATGLEQLGFTVHLSTLNLILPVGISFYTFQTLSYTIDVYRKNLVPTKDFVAFMTYVSFFPQLVAGPIERAKNLLPQFYIKRSFDYQLGVDGLKQMMWGLFKKVVVADNCAVFVNEIFNQADYTSTPSIILILGAVLFAFQIYCDFSGYSDIAIGAAKLFGIRLMTNFKYPYFSRDIAEFWRRWHISLSSWFRDYIYFPLGGSRTGKTMAVRNIFVIFLVSGFWHGANWTFLVWGFFNALLFVPLYIFNLNRKNLGTVAENSVLPNFKDFLQIVLTFSLVCFAWIFFRADNISLAFNYIQGLFSNYDLPALSFAYFKTKVHLLNLIVTVLMILVLILIEWLQRHKEHGFQFNYSRPLNWGIYIVVFLFIIYYGEFNQSEFIYFQF